MECRYIYAKRGTLLQTYGLSLAEMGEYYKIYEFAIAALPAITLLLSKNVLGMFVCISWYSNNLLPRLWLCYHSLDFFLYSSPLSSSTSHYGVKQQYQQQHYSTKARYRKTLITLHCIRLRARNFSRDKQQRRQIDGRTQRQSTAYKSNDFDSFFLFLYFIMKFWNCYY